jgi:L-asparaginase II
MTTLSQVDAPVVAETTRDDRVESVHHGIAVVVDQGGKELTRIGDPTALVFPRSTLKPVQTFSILETGTPLEPLQIALATASHVGSFRHQEAVEDFLHDHQLSVSLLQCPADWPMGEKAKRDMIAAGHTEPLQLAMNCSGKHAGFLACCQHMGWDLENYLDPRHPLQLMMKHRIEDLAGEKVAHTTPDGCGAPLHQLSLRGLAKALATVTNGRTGESVALLDAIRDNSWAIAGDGEANTIVIDTLGGIAKIGAEGLVVISLPGGPTAVVKILDGSMRATTPLALTLLHRLGAIETAPFERLLETTSAKVYGGLKVTGRLRVVV